eukprot:Tamp_09381.p1 GENE.Tamp_09381~~Tamp_09381.p1  ORF type:complete len:556 (-),score=89.82 Tamp_09381:518-2146(-)
MPRHGDSAEAVDSCRRAAAVPARGEQRRECSSSHRRPMRCASLPITLWVCLAANDFPCAWAATRSQPQISSGTLGAPACLRNFAGAHAAAFATHPNVQLPPAQTRDSSRGHALLAPRRAACRHTIRRTLFDVQPRGAICRPRTRMQLESGDSGGDEGLANSVQQWGRHGAKDGPQAGQPPMPNVPETIWAEFRALWLRAALRHAVRHEKYERAGRLKGQLESVQSQLMQAFEGSVHDRVARLRSKMGGSALLRLQHELEHAVAEEDYDRAAKTYQQLQLEHSKTPAFSGGFKVFEWAFLESDLDARIALHSLRMSLLESDMEMRVANLRARLGHDTAYRLEKEMHEHIALEDYDLAAAKRAELDEENLRRDQSRMWVQLRRQTCAEQRRLLRMRARPEKLLEYQLQDAIDREDYESAARFRAKLQEVHITSLLGRLQDQMDRMVAKMEVDAYAALECKFHVAVRAEEFETADQLRRQLDSLERSRMMTVLEEKLVQHGARCFTAQAAQALAPDDTGLAALKADADEQEAQKQFYYLGNLKNF